MDNRVCTNENQCCDEQRCYCNEDVAENGMLEEVTNKKMKKTIKKSILQSGYYYEFRKLYDALPDDLEVPEYRTEIFDGTISHKEILKTYEVEPYANAADAFAVIADCVPTLKKDGKGRISYFNDQDGTLCRLSVWRGGGGRLSLYVGRVRLGGEWDDGDGVLASNAPLGTETPSEPLVLGLSDPLRGEPEDLREAVAIRLLKERGFRITRTEEVTTEY